MEWLEVFKRRSVKVLKRNLNHKGNINMAGKAKAKKPGRSHKQEKKIPKKM